MKRIAIFSDVHGNLQALQTIFEDIDKGNFDEVICLGDVIGVGPNPKECLDLIMDSNIKMVKGNHEIYQTNEELAKGRLPDNEMAHRNWVRSELNEEELKFLDELPMYYEELINGKLFTFAHFLLDESKDYYITLEILGDNRIYETVEKEETDYMFMGHSHEAFQVVSDGVFTCVGSSGVRKNNTTFYTILEIENKNVRMIRKELFYDRDSFEKEVLRKNYPDKDKIASIFLGINLD